MELQLRSSGGDPTAARGTIVFLHGFPFDGSVWAAQLEALPEGWRGLAPDLRGFGRSDIHADPGIVPTGADVGTPVAKATEPVLTMELLANDVAGLIEREEAGPAVVCALSMGGYVAFELWRRRPDLVRALVLVDTRSEPDTDEGREARMRMAQTARDAGAAAIAGAMLPTLLSNRTLDRHPEVADRVREMILQTPPATIIAALAGMAIRHDATGDLPTITVPTLVVVGEEDPITHVDHARAMVERLPDARLEVVPAAAHLPVVEQPEAFNRLLADFVRRLEG